MENKMEKLAELTFGVGGRISLVISVSMNESGTELIETTLPGGVANQDVIPELVHVRKLEELMYVERLVRDQIARAKGELSR